MSVNTQASMADDADSFFMSLRPLLVLGQISGLLPLIGTTGKSWNFYYVFCLNLFIGAKHQGLKFSWRNWQIIYCGVVFVSTVFFNVCSTIDNLSYGIRLDKFGSTVFYSVCILNTLFFVKIAKGLPELFQLVVGVERSLRSYGFPANIGKRVKIFIYLFTFLAICKDVQWIGIQIQL